MTYTRIAGLVTDEQHAREIEHLAQIHAYTTRIRTLAQATVRSRKTAVAPRSARRSALSPAAETTPDPRWQAESTDLPII